MKFTTFFVVIFASLLFVSSSAVADHTLMPSADGTHRISTFDDEAPSIAEAGVYISTTMRDIKATLPRIDFKERFRQLRRCLRVIRKARKEKSSADKKCKRCLKKCKKWKRLCERIKLFLKKVCRKSKNVCKKIKKACKRSD